MAGRKGRSGRRFNIDGISLSQIIDGAISLTWRFMNDERQPLDKRAEIASRFILKRIADKVEIDITHQMNDEQMNLLYERCNSLTNPKTTISLT